VNPSPLFAAAARALIWRVLCDNGAQWNSSGVFALTFDWDVRKMTSPDDSLMLSILEEIRAELRDHRTLLLQLVDAARRHYRRFDDLEQRMGNLVGNWS
jgi:hypothetical protein